MESRIRWAPRVLTVGLLIAGLGLGVTGQARGGKGHHGRGGPGGWIEGHAEELGIDEQTLAEIKQIVDASREQGKAIYEEHRAARDAMRQLLEQDAPDVDAVMRQAEVIGEVDVRKHKHRIATMLEIRAKLTLEQRTQLRRLKAEMRERRGKHRKYGDRHRGDEKPMAEDL